MEKDNKVKNFITVFDETISNCDKINTPEEINKTFESLQKVTDQLLTEDTLVIDHNTLVRYNNFLANEAVVSSTTELGRYMKIFGCLRGFIGSISWNKFNLIEEWYSKELNDENSITNHVIKYFKLLESFYKLLNNLNESFIKEGEKCDERAEVGNMIKIQVRTVKSLREAVFLLSESNSDKDMVELTRKAANELSSFPSQVGDLEPFLVKHYFN